MCFDKEHISLIFSTSLPILILWGPVTLSPFYKLTKKHARPSQPSLDLLTIGYKEDYHFWEFLTFLRKLLILLVVTLFPKDQDQNKYMTICLILLASMYWAHLKKPFNHERLNYLEQISFASLTFFFFGLLDILITGETFSRTMFTLVAFFSIVVFLLY